MKNVFMYKNTGKIVCVKILWFKRVCADFYVIYLWFQRNSDFDDTKFVGKIHTAQNNAIRKSVVKNFEFAMRVAKIQQVCKNKFQSEFFWRIMNLRKTAWILWGASCFLRRRIKKLLLFGICFIVSLQFYTWVTKEHGNPYALNCNENS
jgi:hypothetical protein